jgi:hypothetical protein
VVSFLLAFPPKSSTHSASSHACYMPCPSHSPWLYRFSYIWRRVRRLTFNGLHGVISQKLVLTLHNHRCENLTSYTVNCRVHKRPPMARIPSQMNPVHTIPSCFSNIHFNIILPPKLCLPSGLIPSGFPTNALLSIRATRLAHLILLD